MFTEPYLRDLPRPLWLGSVELSPGDTLMLCFKKPLTAEQTERVSHQLRDRWPGVKIIVFEQELTVVRIPALPEPDPCA